MLVHGRMSTEVITASPRTTVAEALEVMGAHGIRHLPVVDAGHLAGIVTDRDLREAAAEGDVTIDMVMTSPPLVVAPDVPVESAAALLSEHRIGCLPVVDGEELVGILTESDVLRAFVELMVGREPHSRVEILAPDRPGELARIVRLIGIDHGINITGVVVPPSHGGQSLVVLHLETGDPEAVMENLRRLGYESGSPALLTRPI